MFLSTLSTLYLVAAIFGGTILVCQFILALFGLGHGGADFGHHLGGGVPGHAASDSHSDSHYHSNSSRLFAMLSFRTVVAASAFFGVVGLATLNSGFPATTSFVLALAAGAIAMYGMYRLLGLLTSMDSSGNEEIANAIGLQATVYVSIPAIGKGAGKVQLSMQNRIVEYQAVTGDIEPLKTGEKVEVVAIKSDDTVEVRRIAQPAECEPVAII